MNIYFSCSITGGRKDETVYQAIVRSLKEEGHTVPTAHLASPDVLSLEAVVDPVEVFERDIAWIDNAQAMIAEVSTPSHGVGYEIAYALSLGKPVLCCYLQDKPVSKMITGNTHPRLRVQTYQTPEDAVVIVKRFLKEFSSAG